MDDRFIEELASASPAPGGGAAAAYVGVLATCLASMVGNLTVGKKRYASVETEMRAKLARLQELRDRLGELVDADATAFGAVSAAYRMPHDTDERKAARSRAIQQSLYDACEVPLEVMALSLEVAEASRYMAYYGNRSVLSDAGSAASLARAAAHGASQTVIVNVRSMKDWDRAHAYQLRMNDLVRRVDECTEAVETYVMDNIGK